MRNKKGVSALVATVLLVLITIAAVGLIWGAILPLIQRGLQQGQGCGVDVRLIINTQTGYTCSGNTSDGNRYTMVMVERPTTDFELVGMLLQVGGEGFTKSYEIREKSSIGNGCGGDEVYDTIDDAVQNTGCSVYMFNGTHWVSTLELPDKGEARTYLIVDLPVIATQASVAPVVRSGNTEVKCDISQSEEVPPCA